MISFMVYCCVTVVGIVAASFVWEWFDNSRSWQKRVTADDIMELKRLFEQEGAFVAFNEKGEKFLVGYTKE